MAVCNNQRKLSFCWSSERHSELSPPRNDVTNEGNSSQLFNLLLISMGVKAQ